MGLGFELWDDFCGQQILIKSIKNRKSGYMLDFMSLGLSNYSDNVFTPFKPKPLREVIKFERWVLISNGREFIIGSLLRWRVM